MARGKLATVLEAELTSKSPIEISVHEDWFRQRRLYYKKRKDVLATCSTTERNALIEKAREELDACRQRARDAEAREREEAEREAHRERVHQRLMEQRLLKQHADQEALSSELARLHEQQAVEDAKLRAQEAERARKKELVREYLQQRAQLEEERRVRAAEGRQREESERKERVDSERPNVERRGQLYEQKIKARKQREVLKHLQRELYGVL
jgi:FtsZ-interacting cell division protein ZipA